MSSRTALTGSYSSIALNSTMEKSGSRMGEEEGVGEAPDELPDDADRRDVAGNIGDSSARCFGSVSMHRVARQGAGTSRRIRVRCYFGNGASAVHAVQLSAAARMTYFGLSRAAPLGHCWMLGVTDEGPTRSVRMTSCVVTARSCSVPSPVLIALTIPRTTPIRPSSQRRPTTRWLSR